MYLIFWLVNVSINNSNQSWSHNWILSKAILAHTKTVLEDHSTASFFGLNVEAVEAHSDLKSEKGAH